MDSWDTAASTTERDGHGSSDTAEPRPEPCTLFQNLSTTDISHKAIHFPQAHIGNSDRAATDTPEFKSTEFHCKKNHGDIDFHEYVEGSWAILFSHPADFTLFCTTEPGAFAKLKSAFEQRGVKMIGLSANDLNSDEKWIKDINISQTNLQFPIIVDADRKIAWQYDMVDHQDRENVDQKGIAFTIRSIFIIDPAQKVRLAMMYPASCGSNKIETLRVIDALQTGDKKGVTMPIDWKVGEDVIVPPTVSTPDAQKKFEDVREVRPHLGSTRGNAK